MTGDEFEELKSQQKNSARQKERRRSVSQELRKKSRKSIQKINKYQIMTKNFGSELSLVIALVIDDQTVIDLARIGSFATPDP